MMNAVVETKSVRLDTLRAHPENARRGQVEKIKESLLTSGQYRSIVVNKNTMEILAGTHTWMACGELGMEEVLVDFVDATPEGAKVILLADNKLNDDASYYDEKLAALLESMMLAGQLKGSGWNPDEVDDLLSKLDALPETTPEDFKGDFAESAEDTAARYRPPTEVQPMRQFVFLFPQDQAAEVETNLKTLAKAWGVGATRDVVAEALRRAISAEMDKPTPTA